MASLQDVGASLILRSQDGAGELWVSGAIPGWIDEVDAVFDMEGGLDPVAVPYGRVYVCCPINDGAIDWDMRRIEVLARAGAKLVQSGAKVLVHCGAGKNRANLVATQIVRALLRLSADEAIAIVRHRRPGALSNEGFVAWLRAQTWSPARSY